MSSFARMRRRSWTDVPGSQPSFAVMPAGVSSGTVVSDMSLLRTCVPPSCPAVVAAAPPPGRIYDADAQVAVLVAGETLH
jgi:hypothetical protein